MDFGACQLNGSPLTQFRGTEQFCAPEILTSETFDGAKAEVFAVGILLLDILVVSVNDKVHSTILKGDIGTILADVSADLQSFIQDCCILDPSMRASMEDLRQHTWLS